MINYKSLIPLILLFTLFIPVISAETICEFNFFFHKNDTVELTKINNYLADAKDIEIDEVPQSDYVLLFKDTRNNVIDKVNLPVLFYIFDAPETNVDSIPLSVRKPCNNEWIVIDIMHNDKLIFSLPVKELICNNDKICNDYESYLTCSDCPSGSKDGWCDRKLDSVCDPDCIDKTLDLDCKDIKKELSKGLVAGKIKLEQEDIFKKPYVLVLAVIIVLVVIILFNKSKRKR